MKAQGASAPFCCIWRKDRNLNVLSLFDGMSCGRIALERAGIKVDNYFASEIDKHAIKVSKHNYPDIIQLGDVTKIDVSELPKIDLLIGGSPCQGFSLAGKQLNFEDHRSALFFEYLRVLKAIKVQNPDVKFLLENVKMKREHVDVISELLGVQGRFLNSSLFSAQNRPRWYWTNIDFEEPIDKGVLLEDILENEVQGKYYIKGGRLNWLRNFGEVKQKGGFVAFNPLKAKCLTVRSEPSWNCTYIIQWPRGYNKGGIKALNGKTPSVTTSSWEHNNLLLRDGLVRKLTPIECERLQTVPDDYTSAVSDSQRYKMLGNGWTVDVIAHIFQGLKERNE